MGLIKAGTGALGGTLADQWKEFFYCEAITNDTLVKKGQKRTSSRSSNTKGEDNIISNGSGIAVADGQAMIIVEQGKVVEFCAEPGEFTWNSSTEPSIFTGSLGETIIETFKLIGKRFTYGGDTGKDQRIYYFNTKEIVDNKFGSPTPIPFRVVDSRIGLDIDVSLRCSGVYSFKISNPLLFYKNVCGNVSSEYTVADIASQLKTEFISAFAPSIGKLSTLELRPNEISNHTLELCDALNAALDKQWSELRGLEVVNVALNPITLPEEDQELIKTAQKNAMYRDPSMAAATLVGAQADAMRAAAENKSGAAMGFMGMNMAQSAGGVNAQSLYNMASEQNKSQPAPSAAPAKDSWKCSCGNIAFGKFCAECGAKRPDDDGWTCACGSKNKGKFCSECGAKKPSDAPLYACDKCGWKPEDPKNPPKFCPECGDRFDDNDAK